MGIKRVDNLQENNKDIKIPDKDLKIDPGHLISSKFYKKWLKKVRE